jgi:hypothetical protein
MGIVRLVWALLRAFFTSRAYPAAENVLLRQQLIVLQRSVKRPQLRKSDRIFLSWLSRLWWGWRSALLIVQAETMVRWHRQGFRLYQALSTMKLWVAPTSRERERAGSLPHEQGHRSLTVCPATRPAACPA